MSGDELRPVTVTEVRHPQDDTTPVLVLEDAEGRQVAIPVGLCEAMAVQLALGGAVIARPLTHDLLLGLTERLAAPVAQVVIDDYSNGTFYARLVLNGAAGSVSLDCRPSDGIALGLRAHAPILVADAIFTAEDDTAT